MKPGPAPSFVRRTLFVGEWLQIGHIAARPATSECGEVESSDLNVLALPLAGLFAKHDGPRRQAIATPSHALLISAGKPYRLSFPGCIGDRCLALRLGSDALAHLAPEAMAGGGFDEARLAGHALLPPELMLARSRLWRDLASGEVDALEAEERGIALLGATLRAARGQRGAPRRSRSAGPLGRTRRVARTVEAICAEPQRKWTLGELAGLACLSPGHLAHVFRAEMGTSVYDFVLRSRLAGALDVVLDTDVGLTEIAIDAGFASHSHFTAKFRAFFGRTPQALRRGVGGAGVRELRRIVAARELAAA
ncbi:MAG: AraC family transcriptional regulator [Burkholderiales bacterium]|nr:AraC family transcriptional regulator [Burkholderiales bacterium]